MAKLKQWKKESLRPSLKNCQGVTGSNISGKKTTGREFFFKEPFQIYNANVALMSTNIKLPFVFSGTEPKIKYYRHF